MRKEISRRRISSWKIRRQMIQKVTYIAKGEKEETYQPAFAIFGFQLAKITGLDEVNPEDFTAVAVYSDMGDTGDFSLFERAD